MRPTDYVPLDQLATIVAAHRAALGAEARVAFVLAPGGAAGAYQAGALQALAERHVRPDLLVGASSGALNGLGALLDALAPLPARAAWPPSRLGRLWRRLGHRSGGAALLVDRPHLLRWLHGRPGEGLALVGELLGRVPHLGAGCTPPSPSLFGPEPLRGLLARAIAHAMGTADPSPGVVGPALADAWAARHAAGAGLPTLVVVATDLQTHAATPFVLGDPEVAERLFRRRHPVRALGHGGLAGEAVVDAFLASAAIPGAFPSVTLPADSPGAGARRYADGAIAASEPFHLAIDAGATLVVSLEVAPFARAARSHDPGEAHPLATAADTLMAIQERYLRADARGVAAWNARLVDSAAPGRRHVPLFRLAPAHQAVGLLDFDGGADHGDGATSLFGWYMAGYGDAGGHAPAAWATYARDRLRHGDAGHTPGRHGPGFWEATFRPAPGYHPPVAGLTPAGSGGGAP
jgi:predicted acylesterase/phospholipase RssA